MKLVTQTILSLSLLSAPLCAELVKTYFEHGNLKAETNYLDVTDEEMRIGVKEGIEKVYYEMGSLAYSVNYSNDKRNGMLIWYDKESNKIADMFYKNGK